LLIGRTLDPTSIRGDEGRVEDCVLPSAKSAARPLAPLLAVGWLYGTVAEIRLSPAVASWHGFLTPP